MAVGYRRHASSSASGYGWLKPLAYLQVWKPFGCCYGVPAPPPQRRLKAGEVLTREKSSVPLWRNSKPQTLFPAENASEEKPRLPVNIMAAWRAYRGDTQREAAGRWRAEEEKQQISVLKKTSMASAAKLWRKINGAEAWNAAFLCSWRRKKKKSVVVDIYDVALRLAFSTGWLLLERGCYLPISSPASEEKLTIARRRATLRLLNIEGYYTWEKLHSHRMHVSTTSREEGWLWLTYLYIAISRGWREQRERECTHTAYRSSREEREAVT